MDEWMNEWMNEWTTTIKTTKTKIQHQTPKENLQETLKTPTNKMIGN